MLDVRQSRELQAALLAMKLARTDVKRQLNRDARARLTPIWTAGLNRKATSTVDRRALIPGARIAVSDRRISAQAATSRKRLSGGLIPAVDYGPLEWGAHKRRRTVESRSRRGKAYRYARTVNAQFRPWSKHGHTAMAVAGDVIGEAVVLWLQVIVGGFKREYDVKAGR